MTTQVGKMKAYKVFNSNFTCRDYQFQIGKTYTHKGKVELCKSGFHFCVKLVDCFNYYGFDPNNIVCEVEVDNYIILDKSDKGVCASLTIIKQLNWHEVLDLVNLGKDNTGFNNSGNYNSGNYNSGLFNIDEPNCRIFGIDCGEKLSILYNQNKVPFVNLIFYDTETKYNFSYKEAWTNWWKLDMQAEKQKIFNLPNFNAKIFEEITGIVVDKI